MGSQAKPPTKSQAIEELTKKFQELRSTAIKKGVCENEVKTVFSEAPSSRGRDPPAVTNQPVQCIENESRTCTFSMKVVCVTVAVTVVSICLGIYMTDDVRELFSDALYGSRCLVENGGLMMEIARPTVDCSMCEGLREVPVEYNISTKNFSKNYAYTNVPVLIKDATKTWSAMGTFSYDYLKKLYTETKGALEVTEEECQFFPYKTDFSTLAEAFNMSDKQAHFEEGGEPWYIGWSNCHPDVAIVLREHYKRPYFLPSDSESSVIDWIFMGGSGLGAFVHLDYVQRPSWQAQISGTKTWDIIPPPECESVCHSMNVTVHKGDIIVLDTNQWYHATYIHPGEISITIGSEYD